jgi:hypothetical protein
MIYLTHHFAHSETLVRARRWLMQAGISPDRILVHDHGSHRLTVAAEPAEVDSIQMIVRIAGMNDPDGLPSLWDIPHDPLVDVPTREETSEPSAVRPPSSFSLGWTAVDPALDELQRREIDLQRAYLEMHP